MHGILSKITFMKEIYDVLTVFSYFYIKISIGGSSGTFGTAAAKSSTLKKDYISFLREIYVSIPTSPHVAPL